MSDASKLDRFIAYVSPAWGASRLRDRMKIELGQKMMAVADGYVAGRTDRRSMQAWVPREQSADRSFLHNQRLVRSRCQDLVRNSPIAAGAKLTAIQKVIGTGLTMQPKPDAELLRLSEREAEQWQQVVQSEFRPWAESVACDITREQNFYQMQALVWGSVFESGDCFTKVNFLPNALSQYELTLQVLEADLVANPYGLAEGARMAEGGFVAGGVHKDAFGAALRYHVLEDHPGSLRWVGLNRAGRWIPAWRSNGQRNMLHHFQRQRPGQTRGIPSLAPVVEAIKQLTEYTQAELDRTVIQALFTVFVKSPASSIANPPGTRPEFDESQLQLGKGTVVDLGEYDDIKLASPQSPNQNFDAFVRAFSEEIGMAIGIPFEVLRKHFTASYSASRAALLEVWKFVVMGREFVIFSFCQPVYELFLFEAVASGKIRARGFMESPPIRAAYSQAEWLGDAPGSIDPIKEVQAAKERVALEVSTLTDETLLLTGKEWRDVHRERIRELEMQRRDATLSPPAAPAASPTPAQPGSDREAEQEEEAA